MTLMIGETTEAGIGVEQFGQELSKHLTQLRRAMRQMLTELGSPRTPTLLQRQLGAGYTICWQIFQVARSDDQSTGTQNAPSLGALKRLVVLAMDKGLTPETAAIVQAAADEFHSFIRQHAEDRDYFDTMVAGASPSKKAMSVLVQRRRAAYRANSHVWGSQNDLWLLSSVLRRSADDPAKVDLITLARQQGLRRLRADANVYLMAIKLDSANHDTPSEQDDLLKNALDPVAAAETGMPLISEFSTHPLPRVNCTTTRTGARLFNWLDDTVGLKSSCDIVTGTINRGVPMIVEGDGRRQMVVNYSSRVKPSALLVMDLVVHRDSFPGINVESVVHASLAETTALAEAQAGLQFVVEEDVTPLGRADATNLAEFPQYRSLLQDATTKVGWRLSEFDVYRLRMAYPIMGAVHRMFFFDPLQ
ncbi:MAG: hypothetical protein JWM57_1378 [Phycisphaerales bacterium]|nr:hypothetical protein [Phycisphaerales bacterium]